MLCPLETELRHIELIHKRIYNPTHVIGWNEVVKDHRSLYSQYAAGWLLKKPPALLLQTGR
jgi:hypothetical protein